MNRAGSGRFEQRHKTLQNVKAVPFFKTAKGIVGSGKCVWRDRTDLYKADGEVVGALLDRLVAVVTRPKLDISPRFGAAKMLENHLGYDVFDLQPFFDRAGRTTKVTVGAKRTIN